MRWVSNSWSSEPQLAPMRTGLLCLIAVSTMAANCRSFFSLKPTLPGLMRYLSSACGAGRMIGEELVADVMKVPDDRDVDPELEEPFLDMRHGSRRLVAVDGDAHDFRTCSRELRHLPRGRLHIGGIRVGHGLHDDGRAAADRHAADITATDWRRCCGPASVIFASSAQLPVQVGAY